VSIDGQADAAVGLALRLTRPQTLANKDKKVTLFVWTPPGRDRTPPVGAALPPPTSTSI